jgi:hypothetical protein
MALIDSPEAYRKQALQQLRARNPDVYGDLEKQISRLQELVYKKNLDPILLFPRVATSSFIAILPLEALLLRLQGGIRRVFGYYIETMPKARPMYGVLAQNYQVSASHSLQSLEL